MRAQPMDGDRTHSTGKLLIHVNLAQIILSLFLYFNIYCESYI